VLPRIALLAALTVSTAGCGATIEHASTGPTPLGEHFTAIVSAHSAKGRFLDLNLYGAAADGHGGWFVAGNGLLGHLSPDGHLVPHWGTADLLPCDLARSGRRLYVPLQDGRVAAFSTRSGARLWVSRRLSHRNVYGCAGSPIAVSGSTVYVGAPTRWHRLAALDAGTGRILAWHAGVPRRWAAVTALALHERRLYAGGTGGVLVLDAVTGTRLPWSAKDDLGEVDALLVTHGKVFTSAFDTQAVLSERTGKVVPPARTATGTAYAIEGDVLYVGGDIRRGNSVRPGQDHNLGAFNLATRRITPWAPRLDNYVNVSSIVPSATRVLVLGIFENTIG
jgi:outer membrane protein assembly factor BamB